MKLKKKVSEIDYDLAVSLLEDHGTKYLLDTFELTDEFIGKNLPSFDWDCLTREYIFSQDQLITWRKYITSFKYLNYKTISNLSPKFIETNKDYLDFNRLSFLDLDSEFVEKYKDRLNWDILSTNEMSEVMIEKYEDLVNWTNITMCQDLSKEFHDKYKDKLNYNWVSANPNSKPFHVTNSVDSSDLDFGKALRGDNVNIGSDLIDRYSNSAVSHSIYNQYIKSKEVLEKVPVENKLQQSILDLVANSGLEDIILKELLKRKGI